MIFRKKHHVAYVVKNISSIKGLPVAAFIAGKEAIRASLGWWANMAYVRGELRFSGDYDFVHDSISYRILCDVVASLNAYEGVVAWVCCIKV